MVIQTLGAIIPLIMEMMKAVEADLGQGTGATKKDAVMTGIQAVIADQGVWSKTNGIFSVLIDVYAKLHFGAKA